MGILDDFVGGAAPPPSVQPQPQPQQGGVLDNFVAQQQAAAPVQKPDWTAGQGGNYQPGQANPLQGALDWVNTTFGNPSQDFMATGNTEKGEPIYGDGIQGWARRTFARHFDPNAHNEGVDYAKRAEIEQQATQAADMWAKQNPGFENFKDYAAGYNQTILLNQERMKTQGVLPVIASEALGAVKTVVVDGILGGIAQTGDWAVRQVLSASQGTEDIANASSTMPQWKPLKTDNETLNSLFSLMNHGPFQASYNLMRYSQAKFDEGNFAAGVLSTLLIPTNVVGSALVGALEANYGSERNKAIAQRDLQGSNMIYTQMWDEHTKAEIQRALDSGVSLANVQEKFTNPWVELGVSIFADPLNLINPASKIGSAKALFNKSAIEGFDTAIEALGKVAGQADSAKAVGNVLDTITKGIGDRGTELATLAKKGHGLFDLTADGKQFVLKGEVGNFISLIVGQYAGKGEHLKAVNVLADMVKLATGTVDEQNAVVMGLLRTPAGKQVTSRAGLSTMALFQDMLKSTDEAGQLVYKKPTEFLDTLLKSIDDTKPVADQVESLAATATKLMDNATEALFPSVRQMKEAGVLVKSAKTTGAKIDDATATLAKGYDELPAHVKALSTALDSDSLAGQTYSTFNKFFAGVYMGLSPAFAMRNALTNTVSIMADAGLAAGVKAQIGQLETLANVAKASLESVATGNRFEDIFQPGATHLRALETMKGIMGGTLPHSIKNPKDITTDLTSKFGVLGASSAMEQTARAVMMADTMTKEVDRALRAGLMPDLAALQAKGFTPVETYRLADLVRQSRGDTKKALATFASELEQNGGRIELWRTVQPTEKMLGFMDGVLQIRDKFNDLRNAIYKTPEELSAAVAEMKDALRQSTTMAQDELARVAEDSLESKMIDGVVGGLKGKEAEAVDSGFNHMAQTFRQARTKIYDVLRKTVDSMPTSPEKDLANRALQEIVAEPLGEVTANKLDSFRSLLFDTIDEVGKKRTLDEAAAFLDSQADALGVKTRFMDAVDPTGKISEQQRRYYRLVAAEYWGTFNSRQAEQAEALLAGIGADKSILDDAYKSMSEGFRLSDAFVQGKGEPDAIKSALGGNLTPEQQIQGSVNDLFSQAQAAGYKEPKIALLNQINADARRAGMPEFKTLAEAYSSTGRKGQVIRDALTKEGRGVDLEKFNAVPEGAARRMRDTGEVTLKNLTPEDATKKYIVELKEDILKQADISVRPMMTHDPNTPEKKLLEDVNTIMGKSYKNLYEATPEELVEVLEKRGRKINLTRASDQALVSSQPAEHAAGSLESVKSYQSAYGGKEELFVKEDAAAVAKRAAEAAQKFKVSRPVIESAGQHSIPSAVHNNLDGFFKDLDAWEAQAKAAFGTLSDKAPNWTYGKRESDGPFSPPSAPSGMRERSEALRDFAKTIDNKMGDVRGFALQAAEEKANFALLAYGDKRYVDRALAFVYPYQYWHSRTYLNWGKRMVESPGIIAAYAKYRRTMEQLHAGMPEWWKYNLSTNDLPGEDVENPMYFNLEATLNPLNGLTGIDFEDPKKRVDWLSRTVDDLGKIGPSTFTPLSWLVAASLYAKGEEDAATRWMGRLIPQTASLKSTMALLNVEGPTVGEYGKANEYDPFVSLFAGGLDPYERGRVGRALGMMVDNQQVTPEQAIDAANSQSGPVWDAAVAAATDQRAGGQVASFFLGVGFKNRSPSDIEIDNFYTEYGMLVGARSNIHPDKYREAMTMLGEKYPFMDTVLISRRADDDRNTAYAYNVIGRIPPGQSKDLYETVGITSDMVSRFYDQKGTFKDWTQADVSRFMAGVADLGALLAIPDYGTRTEWNAARTRYGQMNKALESQFGPDILDKIDHYFDQPKNQQETYIALHPEVRNAFDAMSAIKAQDPLMYKYYGGLETVNRFYKSQMYAALDKEFGTDIQAKWNEYYGLQISSTKLANAYKRQHPELAAWSKRKAAWEEAILKAGARVASYMPDRPFVPVREDFQPQSQPQENLAQVAQGQPRYQWDDYKQMLGSEALSRLVLDYWLDDRRLSAAAERQLDFLAPKFGFEDGDMFLQSMGASILQGQPQQ